MRPIEMFNGARDLAASPALYDVVTVRSGEAGPTAESIDKTSFVLDALAHAVSEGRSLENAQTQLDSMFPGYNLSLAAHIGKLDRDEQLRRGY